MLLELGVDLLNVSLVLLEAKVLPLKVALKLLELALPLSFSFGKTLFKLLPLLLQLALKFHQLRISKGTALQLEVHGVCQVAKHCR